MHKDIIKFIKEVYDTNEYIPLHRPIFNGNEVNYLKECIDSTFVSSVGPFVDKFELMMSKITNTNKVTAVVNGTSALQIALKIAGVTENTEVITQGLTFVATANAIKYNNAHPIFIDVDLETMGLSAASVELFLNEFGEIRNNECYNKKTNRKISACVPMHTFGFPTDIDKLINVCEKWSIPVIEDAAEGLGSRYKNKPLGSFGLLNVFSFNGNKIVTSGGGGAITTNNISLGNRAKFLTTTAKEPHQYEFIHNEIGFNFRMPNINAALACAQLEQLEQFIENKRELANQYNEFFSKKGIKFKTEPKDSRSNYWLMSIELNNKQEKELLLKTTNENSVMTRPIWKLMWKLPMYESCQRDHQMNSIFLEERIVNIPSSVR